MTFAALDDRLSVAPQLAPEDIADAAARGFRLLICNRPDGEVEGQPRADALAAALEAGARRARDLGART